METSASFEARSAPLPYPTTGMKQRMKEPYGKGVAIRSASSLARGIARYSAKRRQRIGGVGTCAAKAWSGRQLNPIFFDTTCDGAHRRFSMTTCEPSRNGFQRSLPGALIPWRKHGDRSEWRRTPRTNGWGSGIWGSGGAPAADSEGYIYFSTGNGTFDGVFGGFSYGESILKLSTSGHALTLTDYFAPYNESFLDPPDADLGSGGVTLVPDQSVAPIHMLIGGGKDGTLYVIDRDNMGQFNRSNDDQVVQNLIHAIGGPGTNGVGHQGFKGIWPKAAYWQHQIYYAGVGDFANAFRLNDGQLSVVPVSSCAVTFRYPGGLPAVSANGNANGIVWTVMENTPGQLPAVLYAFDAADLSVELYNSSTETTGIGIQFGIPTVANGHVFVGTSSELDVFGLKP